MFPTAMPAIRPNIRAFPQLARQRGQALIFGLFVLVAGLAGMFFMFNTGQLSAEKTKLVNTADAVAYSAAVMHARALNFDAYTNRAMIANEVTIAQMVSVSSWLEYVEQHSQRVAPLNCYPPYIYSVPGWLGLIEYFGVCSVLAYGDFVITPVREIVDPIAQAVVAGTEASKLALQAAQDAAFVAFLPARKKLMEQVADANYAGLGPVKVEPLLQDNYLLFDGGPIIKRYSGSERTRFKEVEVAAAYGDDFVEKRGWVEKTPDPLGLGCNEFVPMGTARHDSNTKLQNFDSWIADDKASLSAVQKKWDLSGWIPKLKCKTIRSYALGNGKQSAKKNGGDWYYSGVPSFYELSTAALGYKPNHSNQDKREVRLKFSIRLTRGSADLRTSSGTSLVKPTGQMAIFDGAEAKDVMAAVSSSEVFFERPIARTDGKTELASLFNPYWQAHLIGNSAAVKAAALALQNP
ncbi:hypothetical protein GJV26_28525 [Massilia dura]|uniref:Putative Flp pilus-assembly TadG-like N-terminal domain-containing protein n=1 Tax=Pseudoduganella dura TaxID=321982 RepID=A0A6I3XSU7_9BURK|nr:pilus assembly protein TadG-related protein [Pseudoduganella dura]MUI16372.1 hypothetical protein [Pseudoduganella dura]GGX86310.1 hypothetical protein GCM10007386_16400 [Pseudoduganella dura]